MQDHVEALRTEVERDGAALLIVALGDPISVRGDRPELLAGVLDATRSPWLDLRDTKFPRIPGEGHFSPTGNREAARLIVEWMLREGLAAGG